MSLFNAAEVTCPQCGHDQEVMLVASVNAGRRPDLRRAILDRTFQAHPCELCQAPIRLPLHMTYLDMGRGAWFLAEAVQELPEWPAAVAEAQTLFDGSFGSAAPPAARSLAEGVSPRIVFGWPALREKIICNELGLDDVVLEMMKAAILRSRPDAPMATELALRLAGGNDEVLAFEVAHEETEEIRGTIEVPRPLYDDIKGDEAWAELRGRIGEGPFVDLKRLMVEGREPAEAA